MFSFARTSLAPLWRQSSFQVSSLCPRKSSINARIHAPGSFTLNTGDKIPAIGVATFQDSEAQEDAVCLALKLGLRLIDTARVYDVEPQVGRGMKKSGVPREDIFLATKLWCSDYHPEDVECALDDSLRDLETPYVDLLLMHYPVTFKRGADRFPRDQNGHMVHGKTTFVDTWKAMQGLVKGGKVKNIGVSNFSQGEIQMLLDQCSVVGCSAPSQVQTNPLSEDKTNEPRCLLSTKWKSTLICSKRPSTLGCPRKTYTSCNSRHWAT